MPPCVSTAVSHASKPTSAPKYLAALASTPHGSPEIRARESGAAPQRDAHLLPGENGCRLAAVPAEKLIESSDDGDLDPPDESSRFVILTSGTTGTPKGAPRKEAGIPAAVSLLSRMPLRAGWRTHIAAPLFHTWGFAHLALAMLLGSTALIILGLEGVAFAPSIGWLRAAVFLIGFAGGIINGGANSLPNTWAFRSGPMRPLQMVAGFVDDLVQRPSNPAGRKRSIASGRCC